MNETIGNRIKKIRLAKGYTRKELGTLMNMSCPDSRIEEYAGNAICVPILEHLFSPIIADLEMRKK